ncbi:UDP-N-acetylmuramate dehydrogenase [Acidiferrobacter sp.]|uniref:UDP-N-acetylmuramate dehydrogenase n=1 Tax=Acidiferrobacter sp. TaxID=1872107 RepID=UPI00261DF2F0|nr:UDP-N-acetylmuramate dehydrogenase [Acidiferrobacter sp.]
MSVPTPMKDSVVRHNEPLSGHTTWRVGGPADLFYVPPTVAALAAFLAAHRDLPLLWLGLGSNTLARDGGFRGVVIATAGGLSTIGLSDKRVRAEAGVPLAKLARFSAQSGFMGLEFLAGIPGTVGGALAMNAGAGGHEIWEYVVAVETIDRQGRITRRTREDFEVGYRHATSSREEWFVGAFFNLAPGDTEAGMARIREQLALRNRTQPLHTANAGSVFRNPPGDYAGRLIEAAGLKGLREGGAMVSPRHANFIVNDGTASAADIERLIDRVRSRVREQTGIVLGLEVKIVGDAP